VCIFGTNIILHSITSSHHSHSITSYIILHQWHKKGIQYRSSEIASRSCAKAQNDLKKYSFISSNVEGDLLLTKVNVFLRNMDILHEA
jgi:hypothetical protein